MALLELDTVQRSAFSHLDFLASAEAGPIARRLRLAWAPISVAADAAIHDYLGTLEVWTADGDPEIEAASAAAAGFDRHRAAMRSALAQIEAFSVRFTTDFVHVTSTLEQLADGRRAADAAVGATRIALDQARVAGLLTHRASALLAEAEQHLRTAHAGPAGQGLPAALRDCADAVAAAHAADHDLQQLPALRVRVQTRISTLRTRLAALQWRADQGSAATWRRLRQEFLQACSADLETGPAQVTAAVTAASHELAGATAAADEQQWEAALACLARTRDALDRAEAHLEAPGARLALLQATAADPQAAYARARFAVRDARMLLMGGPLDPRLGAALDALAGRLDSCQALLDRPHPDWLAYAHSLAAIVDDAHGLVVDIRAFRAH